MDKMLQKKSEDDDRKELDNLCYYNQRNTKGTPRLLHLRSRAIKEYALRAKEYTCGASTSSNINKTNKTNLSPFANATGKEYGCVAHSTAKGTQGEPCFTRLP